MLIPNRMIVSFLADLVCWAAASAFCWRMGWELPFAVVGAFAILYLGHCLKVMVYTHRLNKEVWEEENY